MQTIRFDFIYECLANWSATNVRDIHLDWIHSSAFNYFKFNSSFDANVLSFKLKPQLNCFNPWNLILNALQTSSDANDSFAHRSTGIVIVLRFSVASTFTQNSSVLWNCALNASAWFTQFIHWFICRELIKRFISVAHWFLPLSLPLFLFLSLSLFHCIQ